MPQHPAHTQVPTPMGPIVARAVGPGSTKYAQVHWSSYLAGSTTFKAQTTQMQAQRHRRCTGSAAAVHKAGMQVHIGTWLSSTSLHGGLRHRNAAALVCSSPVFPTRTAAPSEVQAAALRAIAGKSNCFPATHSKIRPDTPECRFGYVRYAPFSGLDRGLVLD